MKVSEWYKLTGQNIPLSIDCELIPNPWEGGKSYAQQLHDSSLTAVESMKSHNKKLYNWISNDFQGLVNKLDNHLYSFHYKGKILSDEFVNKIADILKECTFNEERYDKKNLKIKIEEYFSELETAEGELKYNNDEFGVWNGQMAEFFYKLASKL